jgi:hypothetical protein
MDKSYGFGFAFRWTHTNFSTFHAIQILIVIGKKLM